MDVPSMHIAMYPWFAIGHITPFLQLSNKLAKRGHKISIFIPKTTHSKLQHLNLFPHLITIFPINIPHVHGLPDAAETTKDLDPSLFPLLMTAMDRTQKEMETLLLQLKPNFVFFDFAYWIPNLARKLGIKSVHYVVVSLATRAYVEFSKQRHGEGSNYNIRWRFPDECIKLQVHEEKMFAKLKEKEFGNGIRFYDRIEYGVRSTDAIGFKSCTEIEGPFADYLESVYGKPILLSGPLIIEPSKTTLEGKWAEWLARFKAGSVIFCALGSEFILSHNQFQELLLGLEQSERVKERGIVYGGWVQQQLILEHPSLGCFITHCGASSLLEALLSQCQLILLPNIIDQIINARMISKSLKAGVEIEKGEEDGIFTKGSVCEALRIVMDSESEVAKEIRTNHTKLRTLFLSNSFENGYIDRFCHGLHGLL
ncbi:UDP-glycosyltransferase 79B30-like [Senna tora]|uniref:Glycosyltransferase n=1 Tax=Senna tora TaxID=362788 RepID=A0A834WHV1_9FABA|nr:UDP-glycosyltransferase 79B30-like [Senna tora]